MKAAVGCWNFWITVSVFWLAQRIDRYVLQVCTTIVSKTANWGPWEYHYKHTKLSCGVRWRGWGRIRGHRMVRSHMIELFHICMWDMSVRSQIVHFGTDPVVCHILLCFCGNAHDYAWRVTRQPNGVLMKHLTQKSTLFEPIIVPRHSETSSHCVQEGSADISRSMAAILFETWPCHENVMWSAPSEES